MVEKVNCTCETFHNLWPGAGMQAGASLCESVLIDSVYAAVQGAYCVHEYI